MMEKSVGYSMVELIGFTLGQYVGCTAQQMRWIKVGGKPIAPEDKVPDDWVFVIDQDNRMIFYNPKNHKRI